MKNLISLVVVIAIIVAGIIFVPKLLHTCDDCDKFFIGTGYEPNIVDGYLSGEDKVICEECAKKHHALEIAIGGDLDDYKKDLFD